jgi:RNA polymerase sigma-70 factor (ECF subfamily)
MPLPARAINFVTTDAEFHQTPEVPYRGTGSVPTAPARSAPAVAGCVPAFEEQFDFIHRSLRRQGVSSADVDDLMQEVFIAMWRGWAQFDQTRPLRAWLWGIAFRVARNHLRRRWREVSRNDIDIADDAAPGEANLLAAQARALVLRALARLPEKYRTPLVLHELDGISVNQLAAQLSMPLATAYTRVRRARLAFAQAIGELERAEPGQGLAQVAPGELMAFERNAPAAPARARALLMERVRTLASSPPGPRPRARWPRPVALGFVAVAVLGGILARRGPSGAPAEPASRPAATGSPAMPGPPVSPATLAQGLLGYWTFDEGPGQRTVRDRSGNGRDCQLIRTGGAQDLEWIEGKEGAALDLARQAWLECPQPTAATDRPAAMTVAAWIKVRSFPRVHAAIATRQIGSGFQDQFFLGLEGTRLRVNSHAWEGFMVEGPDLVADRWYHVAFTHDERGSTRLYLDGVEVGRAQGSHSDRGLVTSNLTIGAGQYSRNPRLVRQKLDGALDEVRIYGRALPAAEIVALSEVSAR